MKRAKFATPAIAVTLFGAACMAGCSSPTRGEEAIPPSAQTMASAKDGQATATPPVAGTVYVYDATENRLIYAGSVNGGDKIVVDPGANLITINAVTVGEPHLQNDHMYKIEFNRS